MTETSEHIAARVRETLPAYLIQSPEEIEADKKAQELRRASFGRGKLTEAERVVSRGKQLEEIALSNLPLARNEADLNQERIRYAEGLELQGRYEEASDAHPMEEEKERLLSIKDAIAKDDSAICGCAPTKAEISGQSIEVHPHYEVKKIYSRAHGRMVSLVGCTSCEELNATPNLPEQLSKIL